MSVSKVWNLSEEDDALVLELWIGVMKDSGLQRMTVSFRDYSNRVNFHPTAKFSDLLDIELQRRSTQCDVRTLLTEYIKSIS